MLPKMRKHLNMDKYTHLVDSMRTSWHALEVVRIRKGTNINVCHWKKRVEKRTKTISNWCNYGSGLSDKSNYD